MTPQLKVSHINFAHLDLFRACRANRFHAFLMALKRIDSLSIHAEIRKSTLNKCLEFSKNRDSSTNFHAINSKVSFQFPKYQSEMTLILESIKKNSKVLNAVINLLPLLDIKSADATKDDLTRFKMALEAIEIVSRMKL